MNQQEMILSMKPSQLEIKLSATLNLKSRNRKVLNSITNLLDPHKSSSNLKQS